MNENKIVILFNGPPRCGKDTYANTMSKLFGDSVEIIHLAQILKDATHHALGLNVPFDYFEENKDMPNISLYGRTPRECYIQMSESFLKPLFGNDFFIKKAVEIIRKSDKQVFIISDCGFDEEVQYLSKQKDLECVYIKLSREGKSFQNDSRKYIDEKFINKSKDRCFEYFVQENRIEENTIELYRLFQGWDVEGA